MRLPKALQRFDSANLRLRVASALFMAPIALVAVYIGGIVYGAVLTAAVTIGLYEWLRLVAPETPTKTVSIACALLVVTLMAGGFLSVGTGAFFAVVCTVGLYLYSKQYDKSAHSLWISAGIPYMASCGLALLALRAIPDNGAGYIYFLLAAVWGTDIGAFLVGRMVGGAKLAPVISPGKTWAGLLGGIGFAMFFGYLAALVFGAKAPGVALVLTPVLAIVAQMGDLFESYIKRRANVKESGDIIPGHGGILDRIDGLVFAALFAFFFQATIGTIINWW